MPPPLGKFDFLIAAKKKKRRRDLLSEPGYRQLLIMDRGMCLRAWSFLRHWAVRLRCSGEEERHRAMYVHKALTRVQPNRSTSASQQTMAGAGQLWDWKHVSVGSHFPNVKRMRSMGSNLTPSPAVTTAWSKVKDAETLIHLSQHKTPTWWSRKLRWSSRYIISEFAVFPGTVGTRCRRWRGQSTHGCEELLVGTWIRVGKQDWDRNREVYWVS